MIPSQPTNKNKYTQRNNKNTSTRIIQINLGKSKPCNYELHKYLGKEFKQYDTIIAGIQEPHTTSKGTIPNIPSTNLIYKRNTQYPNKTRAAIFASSGLSILPMPQFIDRDIATGMWTTNSPKIPQVVITSVYMDRDEPNIISPLFVELLEHCIQKGHTLLILSDANAHSPLWGELKTDKRGEAIQHMIMHYNLAVLNRGKRPFVWTYEKDKARTIPDVTMCSMEIAHYIDDWQIVDAVPSSDHRLIQFTMDLKAAKYTFTRNFKGGDWNKFTDTIEEHNFRQPYFWSCKAIDDKADELNLIINKALNITHPIKRRPLGIPELKWETDAIETQAKLLKAAHNKWRAKRSTVTYNAYVEQRRTYYTTINKQQRAHWKEFVEGQQDFVKVAQFNKILNILSQNQLGLLSDENGIPFSTAKESLDYLIDEHFPDCIPIPQQEAIPRKRPCDINTEEVKTLFTIEKLEKAISSFAGHKAAGPDGFKPIVLKHMGIKARQQLLAIIKASYCLGYVPKCWRDAKVIFIPKANKDDYSQARAYRPISLGSYMLKSMEKILLWKLQEEYTHDAFNINQHAFRKGRSTDSALTTFVENIEQSLIRTQYTLGIFLDIQGAFDNVSTPSIINGLIKRKIDPKIIEWYSHYLRTRTIQAEYKHICIKKRPTRGTPQGGVLSPFMWCIAFDALLEQFPDSGRVKITGFADDAAVSVSGPKPKVLVRLAQKAIDKALNWGQQNGLVFAPKKTKVVLFSNKKVHWNRIPQITMYGQKINFSNTVKYLGVTLDHRLNWTRHLHDKVNAAKKLLHKVRNAAGKLWGLNPRMSVWHYRAIIWPKITYASIIWAKVVLTKGGKKSLNKLQRMALMSMGHFRPSTPTAGLEAITCSTPLWILILQEASMAYLRTKNVVKLPRETMKVTGKPNLKGHRQVIEEFMQKIGYVDQDTDNIPDQFSWNKPFASKIDKEGIPNWDDDVHIYTDGSKADDGSTGAAYVVYDTAQNELHYKNYYLGQCISVFQSEIYAIYKAVTHILNHRYQNKTITIHSDSKASILALTSNTITSRQVLNTDIILKEACVNNKITLHWVKAHVNHMGNERADSLAKIATTSSDVPTGNGVPLLSSKCMRETMREKVVAYWQRTWENRTDCRQTKMFFPVIDRSISAKYTKHTRVQFTALVHITTGHNWLKRHDFIVQNNCYPKEDEARCRFCEEDEESSFHILAECPAFARSRLSILGNYKLNPPFHNLKPAQILKFLRKIEIEPIENLFNKCPPPPEFSPPQPRNLANFV